jgi:hypothetical protein
MLTRRTVLKSCAAVAASPVVVVAPVVGAFLVDARFPDARAVAACLASYGVSLRECKRDLAQLYYGWLAHVWKDGGTVAGMTGAAPLFYLERLAWSHGARILFLGRHEAGEHEVAGPQRMVDTFRRQGLARALLAMPAGARSLKSPDAVRDAALSGDRAIFSWVLARPSVLSSRSS